MAARARETLGRRGVNIEERDRSWRLCGDRSGDCRADPAGPDDQTICPGKVEALALRPAHEPDPIEEVAIKGAVGMATDGIARSCHLNRNSGPIEQAHRRDLVRHCHERAADVAETE